MIDHAHSAVVGSRAAFVQRPAAVASSDDYFTSFAQALHKSSEATQGANIGSRAAFVERGFTQSTGQDFLTVHTRAMKARHQVTPPKPM